MDGVTEGKDETARLEREIALFDLGIFAMLTSFATFITLATLVTFVAMGW